MEKVDKITRIKCVKRVDVELQRIFRGLMKKKNEFWIYMNSQKLTDVECWITMSAKSGIV